MINHRVGYTNGLFSGFLWAINAAFLSYIFLDDTVPLTLKGLISLSFFVPFIHDSASAATVYVALIKGRNLSKIFNIKKHYPLVLSGFLAGPIGLTCYIQSIKYLGIGVATSTVAAYPVLIALILAVFFKVKVSFKVFVSIIITVLGCILINMSSYQNDADNTNVTIGVIYAVVCVFSWAFESVVIDRLSESSDLKPEMMFFIRQASSALLYFCIVMFWFDFGELVLFLSEFKYLSIIYVASIFATMSYLYWYRSISIIGAPVATLLNVTYSFWGVIFGVVLFSQSVSLSMLLSLFLIMLGVFILTVEEKKKFNFNQV